MLKPIKITIKGNFLDFFLLLLDFSFLLRPVPDREYVENYIKAFYLSESILEQWLSEHQVGLLVEIFIK